MPVEQLSDDLIHRWPCRDAQIQQISALLSPTRPSPPILVLHGTVATGKSAIINAYLTTSQLPHAIVPCQEAITERHLFERTLALVTQATKSEKFNDVDDTTKCENVSVLQASLLQLLKDEDKFIVVLDGIDELEDGSATLLPALIRMHEKVPSLVLVLLIRSTPPRLLRQHGVIYIHFPPYTREQSIHIVSQNPLDIFPEISPESRYTASKHEEDQRWLWPRYVSAVWDSLGQSSARSLDNFRDVCNKLWIPFIEPILENELGTRDFSRLMVKQRSLFQQDSILLDDILIASSNETKQYHTSMHHEIPYFAKWTLVAAYLAAMNAQRLDATYFMKSTDRKKKKKGGFAKGTHTQKTPRHLLQPSPFTLDRLVAILQAILPEQLHGTIDLHTQLATLKNLRFLSQSAAYGSGDVLETATKWRVGSVVTFELVSHLCGILEFSLGDYLAI